MNLEKLQAKLIRAARSEALSDAMPYAFEKRIMARLSTPAATDPWQSWASALWRAVAPCAAIMLLLAAWSYAEPEVAADSNLPEALEQTVLAAVDSDDSTETLW